MATNKQDKDLKQNVAQTAQSKAQTVAQKGTSSNAQTSAPSTKPWSYDDFKVSDSTAAADKTRQDLASKKPGDFTYGTYEKSDAVKQAEAMLQQHLANKPGEYQSQWQTNINDVLNKILNREKFSYDLNGDALYQQYKDQYVNQGQQAMMDTMGQAQAMTGGYGNSYAQTAGQQTYQGYLQKLNDKVPELYQMALNQYNQEGQELYNQYGLFADRENQDYGRYRDSISDFNTDRDYYANEARYQSETDYGRWFDDRGFAYGQYRDDVGDWQYDVNRADNEYWNQYNSDYGRYSDNRNLSYQQYRDLVGDEQWQKTFDYGKERDGVADSQWEKTFQYQMDRDGVADKQWQATFDEGVRQFNKQYDLSSGKTSNGSKGTTNSTNNTGGGKVNNGSRSDSEIRAMQQALGFTGNDVDGKWGPNTQAKAQEKWGTTDADAAWEAKGKNLSGSEGFTGSTYSEATAYLRANGIDASGVMTASEWARHKNSNNSAGGEHEASSYQEYLAAYIYGKTKK